VAAEHSIYGMNYIQRRAGALAVQKCSQMQIDLAAMSPRLW